MSETPVPDEMRQAIERRASGAGGSLTERIAEKLGGMANISAVYGTPVEREGVTVIPVARVRVGFGAGAGSGSGSEGSGGGEGGGGGGEATPIGYIELRSGGAEFHPIRIPPPLWAIPPIILAGGFAILLILRGLRRLVRG